MLREIPVPLLLLSINFESSITGIVELLPNSNLYSGFSILSNASFASIFLDNLKLPKKTLNDQKTKFEVSDYQKSERDFAFIVAKEVKAQDLINAVSSVDQKLISNIKVFDVYEGENIPENQKSIAISVTIQSTEKTLNDNDLENINNLIIKTVESKTGAKIRS